MQHSMALLTPPVRSSLRRLTWTALALLVLTACGGADDTASTGTAGTVNQLLSEPGAGTAAQVAATAARPAPEPAPPMPAALSPDGERPLLEAIARSYPFRKQIETKEQTGHVRALEAARIEANLDQAKLDLAGIKRNLASLSAGGLPTYALIHSVASNGSLNAWIVFPDGGVVAGATSVPYAGLGTLQGGLGVDRIAETRGPQLKGQEKQRLDAESRSMSKRISIPGSMPISLPMLMPMPQPTRSAVPASATTRRKRSRNAGRPWPRPPQRCCPATFARFSRQARVACWSCPSAIPELRRMRRCRSAIRMTSPRGDGRSS